MHVLFTCYEGNDYILITFWSYSMLIVNFNFITHQYLNHTECWILSSCCKLNNKQLPSLTCTMYFRLTWNIATLGISGYFILTATHWNTIQCMEAIVFCLASIFLQGTSNDINNSTHLAPSCYRYYLKVKLDYSSLLYRSVLGKKFPEVINSCLSYILFHWDLKLYC